MRTFELKSSVFGILIVLGLICVEYMHLDAMQLGSEVSKRVQVVELLIILLTLLAFRLYTISQIRNWRLTGTLSLILIFSLALSDAILIVVVQSLEDISIRNALIASGQSLTSLAKSEFRPLLEAEYPWVMAERMLSLTFLCWAGFQLIIRKM